MTVAALSDTDPVRDATTMRQHIDTKAYRERQRKRIAMGHKPDDHEDEETQTQTWTLSM